MPDILDPDQLLKPGADSPKEEPVVPPPAPTEPPAPAPDGLPQLAPTPPPPPPAPPSPSVPPEKQEKPKNRRNLVIGLALLFLLVSTGAIFIFVTQKEQIADLRNWAKGEGQYALNCGNTYVSPCEKNVDYICVDNNTVCGKKKDCKNATGWSPQCPNWDASLGRGCRTGYYPCAGGCCKIAAGDTDRERGDRNRNRGGDNPTNTPTPTHTGTPTPTGTPTSTPTGTPVPTGTPTSTPTGTPVPTSTMTPTPTATQIVYASCNGSCTVNDDCTSGLVCLDGRCRNASYPESTTCSAPAAPSTPNIPVAGTGPSVLGASVIAGGFFLLLLGLLF